MVTKALLRSDMKKVIITTTDGFIIPVELSRFNRAFTKSGKIKLFKGRINKIKKTMNLIKKNRPSSYKNDSVWKQYNNEINIIKRVTK